MTPLSVNARAMISMPADLGRQATLQTTTETMNATGLESLLRKTAAGDQNAFGELYQLCAPKLNGIAYLVIRDQEKANEVLHDAFLQIWQNADQYRRDLAEPMTWMASIVRFRALDMLRRHKRRLEGKLQQLDETELQRLESQLTWQQQQISTQRLPQGLQRCLQRLPDNHRDAIFFAYLFGHSREDIAHIFDTTVNTVKSWLHRGVRSLQQCLTR